MIMASDFEGLCVGLGLQLKQARDLFSRCEDSLWAAAPSHYWLVRP
jgi:hypothetical protein